MANIWIPNFINFSAIFKPLAAAATPFNDAMEWPSPDDLNAARSSAPNTPKTVTAHPIRFVPQATFTSRLEDKYEPRIFLKGEVQTRAQNWHDFFNALVWMTFPRTKAALNALQYEQFQIVEREKRVNRTTVQDALTIFDEGGAIVVSRDPELVALLQRFAWKELFWTYRRRVECDMRFFLFGHALYEKALTPYKGMTAKCVLLDVATDFFVLPPQAQIEKVDREAANWFNDLDGGLRPAMLAPLPILGVPGWSPENSDPSFYDDKRYFRDHYERASRT